MVLCVTLWIIWMFCNRRTKRRKKENVYLAAFLDFYLQVVHFGCVISFFSNYNLSWLMLKSCECKLKTSSCAYFRREMWFVFLWLMENCIDLDTKCRSCVNTGFGSIPLMSLKQIFRFFLAHWDHKKTERLGEKSHFFSAHGHKASSGFSTGWVVPWFSGFSKTSMGLLVAYGFILLNDSERKPDKRPF